MRIVSLVPSATEMLFALGLGSDLIAVTHECDYPPAAQELPKITRDVLPAGLRSGEIDAAVKERELAGQSIYELDDELLHDLRPDLIVTQALCSVCAVSYDDVRALAGEMENPPRVISLDPRTVGEVLGDARRLAQATDRQDAAVDLVRDASDRIDRVRLAVRGARRPRVVALEWLDPPFSAGHWTPQLIELAGGEDALGFAGEHSEQRAWEEVAAARSPTARPRCIATSWPPSARAKWSPWTRRRISRAPGRGLSMGWSCWPTSCIQSSCLRRQQRR